MSTNRFKAALRDRRRQIGLWLDMADPYAAAMAGCAGFDWLVIDGEHGPNDLRSILAQLQAIEASPACAVVRAPTGERWMLNQLLDIGAQTLIVPRVDTPAQAAALVRAVRYPPAGERGVGAAVARASRFGTLPRYVERANEDVCLIVQAESRAAIANLAAIAAVDGVDGVFIGPADLAADMGHLGRSDAPEVQAAIDGAIATIVGAGKAAGILAADPALNARYFALGASFVAVGADVTAFVDALRSLRGRYDTDERTKVAESGTAA